MAKKEMRARANPRRCCEKPCCQELLQKALAGALSTDHGLEPMLDHLERAS